MIVPASVLLNIYVGVVSFMGEEIPVTSANLGPVLSDGVLRCPILVTDPL